MTRSAAPFANSASAICSIIRACVRSLMPMSTVPLPMGCTSPPSSERPAEVLDVEPAVVARRRIPELEVGAVVEHRVGAVDRGHVVRLEPARRPVHRVDRDAAVDPARRVAREQRVRQRRQDEGRGRVLERGGGSRRTPSPHWSRSMSVSSDREAADQVVGQLVRRHVATAPAAPRRRATSRPCTRTPTSSISSGVAFVGRGQRLGEQVAEVGDLDAALAHPRHELVVLVLRALHPQHVVEEQLVVVRRCQPLQAELRPVHHHLPQLADLGVDAEPVAVPVHQAPTFPACRLGTTLVPAEPSTICSMSLRAPIAARFPVLSTKRRAASTFGPIEPAANALDSQILGRDRLDPALLWRAPRLRTRRRRRWP